MRYEIYILLLNHTYTDSNGHLIKDNCFIINKGHSSKDKYTTYFMFQSLTLCKKKYKYVTWDEYNAYKETNAFVLIKINTFINIIISLANQSLMITMFIKWRIPFLLL